MRREAVERVHLTARELALFRELDHARALPLVVIASRHFADHATPLRAADRCMRLLEAAGYVHVDHHGNLLVSPTPEAMRYTRPSRRGPPLHQVGHHVAVLRILDELRRQAEAQGGRVLPIELPDGRRVPLLLDRHLQNQARRRPGDCLPGVPDGLLQVQLPGRPVEQLAIEYFTTKYSDAQIASKRELQHRYPAPGSGRGHRAHGAARAGADRVRVQRAVIVSVVRRIEHEGLGRGGRARPAGHEAKEVPG